MKEKRANIRCAQLLGLCLKLKQEWKKLANPKKANDQEPTRGEMDLMSVNELPDICPLVKAWYGAISIGEAYGDGGAQISVMTQACMERLGLKMNVHSDFRANHAKVKCLGIWTEVAVNVLGVLCHINCHIMP